MSRRTDPERDRAVAVAKIAARYNVACGGIDIEATMEALLARMRDARASSEPGERAVAEGIAADLERAGVEV